MTDLHTELSETSSRAPRGQRRPTVAVRRCGRLGAMPYPGYLDTARFVCDKGYPSTERCRFD